MKEIPQSTASLDLEATINLVRSAQKGDRKALDDLFRRYAPRVRRIVALRMKYSIREFADFDDIAQQAMIKAFQGLHRFEQRSVGTFRNWMAECIKSAILSHLEAKKALKRGGGKGCLISDLGSEDLSSSIFQGDEPAPSKIAMGKELEERIEKALLAMNDRYRETIILHKLCGLTYGEIAEKLGFSNDASARQVCSRALKKLAEMIGQ